MPLEKLTAFTQKVSDLADKPNATMSAAEVKAQFDAAPDEVRVYLNKLIDKLQSLTDGDSGADNIGVTSISGLTGDSVQELLEALKTLVDEKADIDDVFSKTTLQATTDGTSGADQIKATPISTSPNTVQGILEWLKAQIDTTVLGQIPDGSLTQDKLAFEIASDATSVAVTDTGNYFTSTNAEGALQEIGQTLNSTRGSLVTSANNILGA